MPLSCREAALALSIGLAAMACASEALPIDSGADADASTDAGVDADASTDADADGGSTSRPLFEDITIASGIDLVREPRQEYGTMADRIGGGVCVLDADQTPPIDLFFTDRAGPEGGSRLYIAGSGLSYADETEARGLADTGDALGCLAADIDADGDDDLLVTGFGSVRLYENQDGTFSEITDTVSASLLPDALYVSAAAGDVDRDGDVDLLVAGYQRFEPSRMRPGGCGIVPCEADLLMHVPVPSLLLMRGEDGRFVDQASTLAPLVAAEEPTLVVGIADVDGDDAVELFLGNDVGTMYFNRVLSRDDATGIWADEAEALGLAYNGRGYGIDAMGWTTGDVDANGTFDHVVSSFESDPTALFICPRDGPCEERGVPNGMDAAIGTFRWGAALFDLDLDGDLDLIEATGHVFADDEVAEFGFSAGELQAPNLFLNDGSGTFAAVTPDAGDGLREQRRGRGIATVDLDDDGLLDVVIASAAGRPLVLRNVTERQGRFLRVVLRASDADVAIGALVTVTADGRSYVRRRIVGEGYLGSFDPRLHFGLPPSTERVSVQVRWPSGEVTDRTDVSVDEEIVF